MDQDEIAIMHALSNVVDRQKAEIVALKRDRARLSRLVQNLDALLACYRLGKRPSDKILDKIKRDRAP